MFRPFTLMYQRQKWVQNLMSQDIQNMKFWDIDKQNLCCSLLLTKICKIFLLYLTTQQNLFQRKLKSFLFYIIIKRKDKCY
jgi:folate-binding Fe-S cluster repair protein YgfZ